MAMRASWALSTCPLAEAHQITKSPPPEAKREWDFSTMLETKKSVVDVHRFSADASILLNNKLSTRLFLFLQKHSTIEKKNSTWSWIFVATTEVIRLHCQVIQINTNYAGGLLVIIINHTGDHGAWCLISHSVQPHRRGCYQILHIVPREILMFSNKFKMISGESAKWQRSFHLCLIRYDRFTLGIIYRKHVVLKI